MTRPVITIYLAGWCPYCQRAKALLAEKHLPYDAIDVDDDPRFRREMTERSGRRTVPQIFIGNRHVGGCDDLFVLSGSGELDRMMAVTFDNSGADQGAR